MSPCQDKVILETRNVSRMVEQNGTGKTLVDTISFRFHGSQIYNVVGPSGAGKTSFLRLLNRLDEPTSGEIYFEDQRITSLEPTFLRKRISLIFQEPYMFPGTVRHNLEFCCPDKRLDDIGFHLARVGLKEKLSDVDTGTLSAGEKQRVAIARSLIQKPRVLLLDEPTSALDPTSVKKVEKLILELVSELCLTAIVVTHNPDQARRLGGQTLLLVSGKLIEYGETENVLNNPKTELAKRYLNRELE